MDPQIIASSLATIVGLISNFRQEQSDRDFTDRQEFLDWLEHHRHEEIKNLIANNYHLSAEVDIILQKEHEELFSELRGINEILGIILSQIDNFAGLSHAVLPNASLSLQALEILTTFHDSNAQMLLLLRSSSGPFLCLSPGQGFKTSEPRFLDDDLNSLVILGFLSQGFTSNGKPSYTLTRTGAKFAELTKQSHPHFLSSDDTTRSLNQHVKK